MSNLEQAARQALELRQLANKFSEGWHDGIKIDASDVILLADAAAALDEAEPVRAYYTIDELNKKYGDETGNPSY